MFKYYHERKLAYHQEPVFIFNLIFVPMTWRVSIVLKIAHRIRIFKTCDRLFDLRFQVGHCILAERAVYETMQCLFIVQINFFGHEIGSEPYDQSVHGDAHYGHRIYDSIPRTNSRAEHGLLPPALFVHGLRVQSYADGVTNECQKRSQGQSGRKERHQGVLNHHIHKLVGDVASIKGLKVILPLPLRDISRLDFHVLSVYLLFYFSHYIVRQHAATVPENGSGHQYRDQLHAYFEKASHWRAVIPFKHITVIQVTGSTRKFPLEKCKIKKYTKIIEKV